MKKLLLIITMFVVLGASSAHATFYFFDGEFDAAMHPLSPLAYSNELDFLIGEEFSGHIDFDNLYFNFNTPGYSFDISDVWIWAGFVGLVVTDNLSLKGTPYTVAWLDTDFNGIYDALKFGDGSGNSVIGSLDTFATPAPAAVWLLGSAIVGVLGFRRKFTT